MIRTENDPATSIMKFDALHQHAEPGIRTEELGDNSADQRQGHGDLETRHDEGQGRSEAAAW